MTSYKPKATDIVLNMILVALFVFSVVVIVSDYTTMFFTLGITIGFYLVLILFSKKRIWKIILFKEKEDILLISSKFLFLKKKEKYKFSQVAPSYKIEVGPRGVKRKEFRLYDVTDNKLILKIIPSFMGWQEKDIEEIYNSLHAS